MFRNRIGFAAVALVVAAGCTQARAPRSYVQPNVIKKADLAGTWYYVQTITDAPPTSSSAFTGASSDLQKIRFDIQQDTLYARRAYEHVAGTEDQYNQDPANYLGEPLAAWRISSQFDIIRDYNSTTGEESNKIIESQERPWNEREFFRVDWSQNIATDYVGIGLTFFFDDVRIQSASYWESDPTKPDALHLERAGEKDPEFDKGEANYFDITNKLVVDPDSHTECFNEGSGQQCITYPACFFYYSVSDCSSQVVKVRHAFAKISPKHQYQPRAWDGKQQQLFGLFETGHNKLTYNRQYGVTNSGIQRYAARFNLWKKSYQEDGKTPIPYEQRELRTIPYYAQSTTGTFPPELFDSGAEIIRQWNEAVGQAVSDVTNGAMPKPDQKVFVWCHNPVKLVTDSMGPADADACKEGLQPNLDQDGNIVKDAAGNPIYEVRRGDPRRSSIIWVNEQQNAGPLGYGPPLFDLETGETLSGQANIYGAALDFYAAQSRDLVSLITGKLDPNDFIVGKNVVDWVTANRTGVANRMQTYTAEEIQKKRNSMDFGWASGLAPQAPIDHSSPGAFVQSLNAREDAIYRSGIFGSNQANLGQVNRDKLKGTSIEAKMITPDIMSMSGDAPNTDWSSLSDAEKSRISPLRSSALRQAIQARQDRMRAFGVDFEDFADEGIAQRAINLAQTNPTMDPEAVRQQLRKDVFVGVTLHEVGHNMGLRHNFRASFDAMNYFPQYWNLRQQGASPTAKKYVGLDTDSLAPKGANYSGTDCGGANQGKIRPRYIDCPGGATSVTEVAGGVREFQYSSIMDYGANFNSDLEGLGHYDKAAAKFSYAGDGYVEVFTGAKQDGNSLSDVAALQFFSASYGFPSALRLTTKGGTVNYPSYPGLFIDGIAGLEERKDVPYSDITVLPPQADRTTINDFLYMDTDSNPMVPYYFCSDEFVSNLTCQRFDAGADAFEQAQDLISRYNNYYILNNFKRDRYTFHSSTGYADRITNRYLGMLREQMTWYVLLRSELTDPTVYSSLFSAEDQWGNFTAAVTDGFDLFGKIISTPEAGHYVQVASKDSDSFPYTMWKQNSDALVKTPFDTGTPVIAGLLDGKYSTTTWDFEGCGYYWSEECQARIGYFFDKTIAIDLLSQSQAYFTGRDTSTDVRKYAIGYYLPFKKQMQEKLGALLSGDMASLGPTFSPDMKTIINPGWSDNDTATSMLKPNLIDPAAGFTLQLYAGVYGLSEFPTTYDHDFVETTRIFVLGNGESPVSEDEVAAKGTTDPTQVIGAGGGKEYLTWTDPDSGKTYVARSSARVADGEGAAGKYRNDTGVRMLTQMKTLQDNQDTACSSAVPALNATCSVKTVAARNYKENLDVMRSLHNAFGYGTFFSN